ncbi:DUF2065 domain-containing protein [Galenea microaerophila]
MLEQILLAAFGMMLVLEGLLPFMFPEFWRKMMLQVTQLPENQLRLMGLTSIIIGTFIILILN